MLNSMKSGVPEKDKNATANAPEVLGRTVQPHDHTWAKSEPTTKAGIGDGAQIEGSVIAQNVTVCGRVKGTIRAVRVKLQDSGAVEGDIFHRSLSIDENSLFEGSSRRVENPTDLPSVEAKGPQEEDMQNSALAPYLQRVEASASTEWSESAAEPKH
jgi:hypothetical protein